MDFSDCLAFGHEHLSCLVFDRDLRGGWGSGSRHDSLRHDWQHTILKNANYRKELALADVQRRKKLVRVAQDQLALVSDLERAMGGREFQLIHELMLKGVYPDWEDPVSHLTPLTAASLKEDWISSE